VVYSGDATYSGVSMGMATVNAVASVATTTYLGGPTTAAAGQTLTYTASVSSVAGMANGGLVTFMDGTTTLGTATVSSSGYATFQTSALAVGSHSITAFYGGTSQLGTSTSSVLTTKVTGAYVGFSESWATPVANQAWTLNVALVGTLLANTPRTGTITLSLAGTVLASVNISNTSPNGSGYYALLVPDGLPLGSDALTLAYSGDADYAAVSTTLSINVLSSISH
jgi:hypothetical protein